MNITRITTAFPINYFSSKNGLPETVPEHEPNANPEENLKEPEEDSEPIVNPEEALMRTRSGKVVRPRRHKKFRLYKCIILV